MVDGAGPAGAAGCVVATGMVEASGPGPPDELACWRHETIKTSDAHSAKVTNVHCTRHFITDMSCISMASKKDLPKDQRRGGDTAVVLSFGILLQYVTVN